MFGHVQTHRHTSEQPHHLSNPAFRPATNQGTNAATSPATNPANYPATNSASNLTTTSACSPAHDPSTSSTTSPRTNLDIYPSQPLGHQTQHPPGFRQITAKSKFQHNPTNKGYHRPLWPLHALFFLQDILETFVSLSVRDSQDNNAAQMGALTVQRSLSRDCRDHGHTGKQNTFSMRGGPPMRQSRTQWVHSQLQFAIKKVATEGLNQTHRPLP